jgi:hypothetical protein
MQLTRSCLQRFNPKVCNLPHLVRRCFAPRTQIGALAATPRGGGGNRPKPTPGRRQQGLTEAIPLLSGMLWDLYNVKGGVQIYLKRKKRR